MIEARNLSVELSGRRVLDDVGLTIEPGAFVCLMGPNGAGKTTLLDAIAGLVPHAGTLSIAGRHAAAMSAVERARAVSYLPQGHVAHWPITARDAVSIGRVPHRGGPGRLSAADEVALARALDEADVTHLAERPITELSGGERARVMLARMLAVEAPVILADEPIAALDPAHQLAVMELLQRAAAGGRTVIAAMHDLTLAARFATAVAMLVGGRLIAFGPPRIALTDEVLSNTFGIAALRLEHAGAPLVIPWLRQAELRR